MRTKVVHLTSVHPRFDTRIFIKECASLVSGGYSVTLIVADGLGDSWRDGIQILDAGKPKGRVYRMLYTSRLLLARALEVNGDIYHLHDPELLPVGAKLKKLGKKVIFDAHEDIPKQLLSKPYLNALSSVLLSKLFEVYERWVCPKLDAVVAATPAISDRYVSIGVPAVNVNNFPIVGELVTSECRDFKLRTNVVYMGGITRIRGILEVVDAIGLSSSGARLQLVGSFAERSLEDAVSGKPGWQQVDARGFLNREQLAEVLSSSAAGLVTFLPCPNHIDAQPNKLFEYMSAGLPVIASNFPLWRAIVEGSSCGVCVDPTNPQSIAQAIDTLINDPVKAERLGRNGQEAVARKYNWNMEERKLLKLYDRIIGKG